MFYESLTFTVALCPPNAASCKGTFCVSLCDFWGLAFAFISILTSVLWFDWQAL